MPITITDISDPKVAIYNTRRETELIHMYEPEPGIFIVESEKCILRALEAGHTPISLFLEQEVYDRIRAMEEDPALGLTPAQETLVRELFDREGLPLYLASHQVIKDVTGYNLTSGMLAAFRRKKISPLGALDAPLIPSGRRIVLLDDVENPTNIGAIFRNAAALNADLVLLTDSCADPYYRRSSRVSMGTVFQVPWAYIKKGCDYIDLLHSYGYKTAAMALTDQSVDIDEPSLNAEEKLVIIMGNEGDGLPQEVISKSDYTVCIPMTHGVDSLNVAAASAVAIWQLCR